MATLLLRLLALVAVTMATDAGSENVLPDLSLSVRRPMSFDVGDDALLTCVAHKLGNHTVLWKRTVPGAPGEAENVTILTAGDYRVVDDSRVMVLHDNARKPRADIFEGGEVFVLGIQNVTQADDGMYTCETNSVPVVRSFHRLIVQQKGSRPRLRNRGRSRLPTTTPSAQQNLTQTTESPAASPTPASQQSYDFSECCHKYNVSDGCAGLCSLAGLATWNQAGEADCESEFPAIIGCMADGRNHLACCEEQGVPSMCNEICSGRYTMQTDRIREHFSCAAFSQTMLTCVATGLDTLPAAPENPEVLVKSTSELQVTWASPAGDKPRPEVYTVNVTRLRSFDGASLDLVYNVSEVDQNLAAPEPQTRLYNITAARMFVMIEDLLPLTMYEVSVTAHNAAGGSLTSDRVRAVTWQVETRNDEVNTPPSLPDVHQCCVDAGVTEARCLKRLCDPRSASDTVINDVIVCAPWAEKTFTCMANGDDHSDCCRARGLPPICVQLCAGNVTRIDFRYFRCLSFMETYSSCLMQGYGVLPSAPVDPRVSLKDSRFAVIRWSPPAELADTVRGYTLRVRPSRGKNYTVYEGTHSPYLLEDLRPNSEYEFYLEARNGRGAGPQSSRVLFKTLPEAMEQREAVQTGYNLTTCCQLAVISPACMPLCHYDARMSTLKALSHICAPEYHKLLRCAAGGRDHTPCCRRRGVSSSCLPGCRGQGALADTCAPFVGNLWQCFEEGTDLLPPPVTALHISDVTNTSVTLIWEELDQNITAFQVRYGQLNSTSRTGPEMANLTNTVNVTEEFALVQGLTQGQLYGFVVVSLNEHGTSLPASLITVNVTAQDDVMLKAGTSHPHSLAVADLSATQLTISWAPPVVLHPTERVTYRVSYRGQNATQFTNVTTSALSHKLQDLMPNSMYIAFVTAITHAGDSQPSETLQMWTRPAYPAYVELPTIAPTDMVKEGGSMTVLCIAMASPEPTVALYLNGRHVREERTRHLVTSIKNVTRDMTQVTCYADNGYGTPMQSTRHIVISRRPIISSFYTFSAVEGGSVTLSCKVDASPWPQMVFWRDPVQRQLVIDGGNYAISTTNGRKEGEYHMQLRIRHVTEADFGQFFCHAENVFGSMTKTLTLKRQEVAPKLYDLGVTECCRRLNVSEPCRRACAFDVDIDAVLRDPQCAGEFSKLVTCAADGSDHRKCCAGKRVRRGCLGWCRGEPVPDTDECAVAHAKDIIDCFEDGKAVLPGPPTNVRVEAVSHSEVRVRWDPPTKNADKVELYRVYWRSGEEVASKSDTRATSLRLSELRAGAEYECAVKAGNHYGSSILTAPVLFVPGRIFVSSASTGYYYLGTGVVVPVVLVLVLVLVALVIGAVIYRRRRRKQDAADRVSFENPNYLREMNLQTLQNHEASLANGISAPIGLNVNHNGDASNGSSGSQQMASQANGTGQSEAPSRFGALRNGLGIVIRKAGFKQFENEQ